MEGANVSRRIRASWSLKTLVASMVMAAFLVGVVAIATTPAKAIAVPSATTYYSDATYKKIVGSEVYGCCGEYIFWGKRTAYRRYERLYCLDVLCPF